MNTVLLVDDDQIVLEAIFNFLSETSEFRLLTAGDGRQAVEILEREPVDLLLTDLYMPVMDGFELVAFMVRKFSAVPVIVMSGYEVPEGGGLESQGALCYLEKPLDFGLLAETMRETLARTSKGHLTGISLLGFLQLLNYERKSCTLSVRSEDRPGRIHVANGELINAEFQRLQGETAVFEILSWSDCEIEMSAPQQVERLIHRSLQGVILDAAKDQDEHRAQEAHDGGVDPAAVGVATAPVDEPLDQDGLRRLQALLSEPFDSDGAIGLALVDVQENEVVGYHCHRYWPDFNERATCAAPALKRRLELDDGGQVEETVITLEGLVEVWRPVGRERRWGLYLLVNRLRGGLEAARARLVEIEKRVQELLAPAASGT